MAFIKLTAIGRDGENSTCLLRVEAVEYFMQHDGYTAIGLAGENELRVTETLENIKTLI